MGSGEERFRAGSSGCKGPEVEGSWGKRGGPSKELGFCPHCRGEQGRGEVRVLFLRLVVGQGPRADRGPCPPAAPLGLPGPGHMAAAWRLLWASGALVPRVCGQTVPGV